VGVSSSVDTLSAAGQAPAASETRPKAGPPKRLSDGSPNIVGTWRKVGAGTREDGIEYEAVSVNNENPYPQLFIDPKTGVAGFKVNPRQELHTKDVLREGIVDLGANGRLPWQDWAWKERLAKGKKFQDPESLADVQPIARCMTPSINMHGMSGLFESDAMKVTERYTVTDQDTIQYEVTVDDPKLFTRPWKILGHFERDSADSEYLEDSCVEGQVIGRQLESVLHKLGRGRATSRPETTASRPQ
jgi:hypothetical protein